MRRNEALKIVEVQMMSGKLQISIPRGQVEEFCSKWKITEFSLFGSVLRADFSPDMMWMCW